MSSSLASNNAPLITNFDSNDTNLLLIDNECHLELNACFNILQTQFTENYFVYNNTLIEKSLLINHLPVEELKDGFQKTTAALTWEYVAKFSKVVLVTDTSSTSWLHDKFIDAIFYRILTGKSIVLVHNGQINGIYYYYPYFTKIYTTHKNEKFLLNDVADIDDFEAYEESIEQEFNQEFTNDSDKTKRNRYKPIDHVKYQTLYRYALMKHGNAAKKLVEDLIERDRIDPMDEDNLRFIVNQIVDRLNPSELKYYNAYDSPKGSLTDRLQVSIVRPGEREVHVFKTKAADYHFRNLKFQNVLVNLDAKRSEFVFPLYESEQATRQTIRFLFMNMYKVHNNSPIIDLIIIYLFMRVSIVTEGDEELIKLVKTKYKNVYQLFAKRHESGTTEFICANKCSLVKLKRWFSELEPLDEQDLHDLFVDFVSESSFEIGNDRYQSIVRKHAIQVSEKSVSGEVSNRQHLFDAPKQLDQVKAIEINGQNWPQNHNYVCDPNKLQLNASFPFFVCCNDYDEFVESLNSIEWMSDLRTCVEEVFPNSKNDDKIVLKGGSILDIMCGRKPKDYDLMNMGMSNEEFLKFLTRFVRKTKAERVEFVQAKALLFRVTMPNKDLLEFVLNIEMDKNSLFQVSHLPDQICYLPLVNKLVANELTLWSLNYGYCPLELEKRAASRRLSNKLHLLGLNFFYNYEFKHKTRFLKERLERFVWLITSSTKTNVPSYGRSSNSDDSSENRVEFDRDLVKLKDSGKIIFASRQKFDEYIRHELEANKKNLDAESKTITLNFAGGIILPLDKFNSSSIISAGLDWSYPKPTVEKVRSNYD